MDIGVIVGPLLAVVIFSLFGLSYNRLRRWLGKDIFIKPIYLRSYDTPPQLLKFSISNDSGHTIEINNIMLFEVNGKDVEVHEIIKPFELEDKNYGDVRIKFDGELRDGKNDVRISLAVEGLKGRRGLNKRFSVYLNKD